MCMDSQLGTRLNLLMSASPLVMRVNDKLQLWSSRWVTCHSNTGAGEANKEVNTAKSGRRMGAITSQK